MRQEYDRIGISYNETRKADPYISERLIQLLDPEKDKLYLDIGCGTGNYTCEFLSRGYNFYGVDPSHKMLDVAKEKFNEPVWFNGSSEKIPFENEQFYGGIATLTIHHWKDLKISFKEVNRVLRKNSRLVIFTSLPEQMEGYWLNHYFPEMMSESTKQMPSFEKVNEVCTNANFNLISTEKYFVLENLMDNFLYTGKDRPEIYFDEMIRNGISSFSSIAKPGEVPEGLKKLRADLDDGNFIQIKKEYVNDLGDYIFLTYQKN